MARKTTINCEQQTKDRLVTDKRGDETWDEYLTRLHDSTDTGSVEGADGEQLKQLKRQHDELANAMDTNCDELLNAIDRIPDRIVAELR